MSTRFRIPDGISRARMEAFLFQRHALPVDSQPAQNWRIFDTFDWRLLAQSLILKWSGEELVLCAMPDEDMIRHFPRSSPPRFASDLPEGPFKAQLTAIIEMRALLEVADVDSQSWTYRILNEDEKTIARLIYTEACLDTGVEGSPGASFLSVQPLRGYAKEAGKLADQLQGDLSVTLTDDDVHHWALQAAGKLSTAYTSKLNVKLSPKMPAGEATRLILRRLLETMRANEAGIKADIDIEFLHDYRIALRRTRSALSQMRRVFPKDASTAFRSELKSLGGLTNNLRDLDVYLSAEPGYREILPNAMQADIIPLFDYLRSQRAEALAEVVEGLESEPYSLLMAKWSDFLREPAGDNDPAQAFVPIIRLARKRIARQYGSIVRDGTRILERGEDELLHTLRIECKELRYLLEFFASLFPPEDIAPMIKRLKRLQDNLGAYTDLAVQQVYLFSIAEALDIDKARARRALIATGFLVESMAREQRAIRADFAGTFRDFASPVQQNQFQKLFGRDKGERA